MSLFFNENQSNIRETILEYIPKEAEISRIEFEGPRIAIYTKKPDILIEKNYIVSDIVNIIRKWVVVRSDTSVSLTETDVRKIIAEKIFFSFTNI